MATPDPATITILIAGIISIISAIVTGTLKIIAAVKTTRGVILQGQVVARSVGRERDRKISEIHSLVNGKMLAVLRAMVDLTKKEADRTGDPIDVKAYLNALQSLRDAEDAQRSQIDTQELQAQDPLESDVDLSTK